MVDSPGFAGFSGSYFSRSVFGGGYSQSQSGTSPVENTRDTRNDTDNRRRSVDEAQRSNETRRNREPEFDRRDRDTARSEKTRNRDRYDNRTDQGRRDRDSVNVTVTGLSPEAILNAFRNAPDAEISFNQNARFNSDIEVNYSTNLNIINNVTVTNNLNVTNNINETNNYDVINNYDLVNDYTLEGTRGGSDATEAARALYLVTTDQFRQQLESSQNALNLLIWGRNPTAGQSSFGTTF